MEKIKQHGAEHRCPYPLRLSGRCSLPILSHACPTGAAGCRPAWLTQPPVLCSPEAGAGLFQHWDCAWSFQSPITSVALFRGPWRPVLDTHHPREPKYSRILCFSPSGRWQMVQSGEGLPLSHYANTQLGPNCSDFFWNSFLLSTVIKSTHISSSAPTPDAAQMNADSWWLSPYAASTVVLEPSCR